MCRLHRVLANSRAADRAGFCFSSLAKIFSPLPSFSLYPRCGNFTLYTRSALSRLLACFCFCFVFLFFLLSFLFFFFCRYSCGWLLVAGNKRGVGKIANRRRSVQRRRRRRRWRPWFGGETKDRLSPVVWGIDRSGNDVFTGPPLFSSGTYVLGFLSLFVSRSAIHFSGEFDLFEAQLPVGD